jgi:hypothetical protein
MRARIFAATAFVLVLLPILPHAGGRLRAAESGGWLFPEIQLRVPLTLNSGIYPRKSPLVRWKADFTALLRGANVDGSLDVNSLRVAAATESGSAKEIPSHFIPADGFDPRAAAQGELAWQAPGEMAALESRRYWVYFDVAGTTPRTAPQYPHLGGPDDRPANAVRNPGFERVDPKDPTKPAEWPITDARYGEGRLEIVHQPCHGGRNALKIQCTEGYGFGCRQEKIPMKPNTLYRVSVWARADAANPGEMTTMYILVFLTQRDGRPVATPRAVIECGDAVHPEQWKYLAKLGLYPYHSDVKTPSDTAYGSVRIQLYGDGARKRLAVGAVYVDDVEVLEVRPEDMIPPVGIQAEAVEKADTVKGK